LFAGWRNGWLTRNSKNAGEQNVIPLISSEAHTALRPKDKTVENKAITQPALEQHISYAPEKTSMPFLASNESARPKHKALQKKIKPLLSSVPVTIITADLVPPQKDNGSINKDLIPAPDAGKEKKDIADKSDQSNE